jgi:hypothetical protein
MASTRPVSTSRTGRAAAAAGTDGAPPVSRARWAGVALVLGSLLGAITLGVISPSDPSTPGQARIVGPGASPIAVATPTDTRLPTAQPGIVSPQEGWVIGEWYVDVSAEVPEDALPKRALVLVILRGGEEVKSLAKPKPGGQVTIRDVPLTAGENVLTAALRGPGGLGPESEPVTVTQDRDAPVLTVTTPEDGTVTIDDKITVAGTSEAGATVEVQNRAKGWDGKLTVGPSGSFEIVVPLARNKNRIVARSTDTAGMERTDEVTVVRKDGRPVIKLTAPARIKRAEMPKRIRVVVDVSDVDGNGIEGAMVSYGLGGPGGTTEAFTDETNAKGRSVWQVEVAAGTSPINPIVSVEVIAPNGERSQEFREIRIS